MKSVIVLSPDYLDAIFSESEKFSFAINGYGRAANASKGLLYVNSDDVLGVILVYEDFSKLKSNEFHAIVEFLKKCDLISNVNKKKVVIATRGQLGNLQTQLKLFKNLSIVTHTNVEYFSDTFINKNLFGTILLANYKPYCLKPEEKEIVVEPEELVYKYSPTIPKVISDLVSKVYVLDSFERTLDSDLVYQKFKDSNLLLTTLREFKIATVMKCNTSILEKRLQELINELNDSQKCMYFVIKNMIEEGEL